MRLGRKSTLKNVGIIPFFSKEKPAPNRTNIITILKFFYVPIDNHIQESDDYVISETNVEPTVPTETIHVYVLNDHVPTLIIEQVFLDMNHMYQIPMDIGQELLNNPS